MCESFGKRLKRIRLEKGINQKELAEKIGIQQANLSHYEHDRHVPNLTALEWICDALGVTATELLGY